MLRRRQHCLGALAIALALAAPGPVHAQSDDPQVDPDSPAGIEYELPLDRAREEAGGGTGGGTGTDAGGTAGAAPLFGEGVRSEAGANGAKSPRQGTDSDPATTASVEPDGTGGTEAVVRAQAPSPDGGGGDLLAVGAGAGGVLLLGGLAGLAWRRRSRGPLGSH